MSSYSEAGMVIAYILLFGGSVVLGYYLIGIVRRRVGPKARQ